MDWTEEKVDFLRNNLTEQSSTDVARELGVTRNAVIGKAHRMGIKMRSRREASAVAVRAKPYTYTPRKSKLQLSKETTDVAKRHAKATYEKAKAEATKEAERVLVNEAAKNPVTFFDLKDDQCHYPVENGFCGLGKAKGSSYCAHHAERCRGTGCARTWIPAARGDGQDD